MALTTTLACAHRRTAGLHARLTSPACPPCPPQPAYASGANSFWTLRRPSPTARFYLLDPATGAEYIPVVRGDAVPLTSWPEHSQPPRPATSYRMWIYFPAAPSTTTSLSLVSPRAGSRGRRHPDRREPVQGPRRSPEPPAARGTQQGPAKRRGPVGTRRDWFVGGYAPARRRCCRSRCRRRSSAIRGPL